MKNKWFNEVFLRSLFERFGIGQRYWLTKKQTSICIDNMELSFVDIGGYKHNNYNYDWNGRHVSLSYSKLNGCGTIVFHPTEDEIKEIRLKNEQARLERIKSNPRWLEHEIKRLKEKIENAKEWLSYDDNDEDDILYYNRLINECNIKIKILEGR